MVDTVKGMALYERYRPQSEAELVGGGRQTAGRAARLLERRGQAVCLITGPSGAGKSTLAGILASRLATHELDRITVNIGTSRGLDFIREIEDSIRYAAHGDGWKVYVLEEAHSLTTAAQTALLNVLEHYPQRRAVILTSSEEGVFTEAFRSRCLPIRLPKLTSADICELVERTAQCEGLALTLADRDQIVREADGNARTALNLLEWYADEAPVWAARKPSGAVKPAAIPDAQPRLEFELAN